MHVFGVNCAESRLSTTLAQLREQFQWMGTPANRDALHGAFLSPFPPRNYTQVCGRMQRQSQSNLWHPLQRCMKTGWHVVQMSLYLRPDLSVSPHVVQHCGAAGD